MRESGHVTKEGLCARTDMHFENQNRHRASCLISSFTSSFHSTPALLHPHTQHFCVTNRPTTMAAHTLTIYCLISGEVALSAFPVMMSSKQTAGELRAAIFLIESKMFEHMKANDLVLWQATIPANETAGSKRVINLDDLDDKTQLDSPRMHLSTLFPEGPDDNTYIVVERPKGMLILSGNASLARRQKEISFLKSYSAFWFQGSVTSCQEDF